MGREEEEEDKHTAGRKMGERGRPEGGGGGRGCGAGLGLKAGRKLIHYVNAAKVKQRAN